MYKLAEPADSLPRALKNRYRSADGPALKTALFALCDSEGAFDADGAAEALKLPLETVERAMAFWVSAGLFAETSEAAPSKVKKPAPLVCAPKKTLSPSDVTEISLRDPNVELLLRETQDYIKRPLDSLESRVLLEIYEFDKLPADVILTIIAYLLPRLKNKRTVMSRAARMADDWSERGINDSRLANAEIRLLELREKREAEVAAALGIEADDLNKASKSSIARWYEEYGYNVDFVKEAYLRTGKSEIPYLNSVLKSWHKNGYTTIKDTRVEAGNAAPISTKRERGENSLIKRAVAAQSKES